MRRYKYLPVYLCGAVVVLYTIYAAVFCWDVEYLPGNWMYQSTLREQIDFYAEHGVNYENNVVVLRCLRFCRIVYAALALQILLLLTESDARISPKKKGSVCGIMILAIAAEFFMVKYYAAGYRLFMLLLPACLLAAGGMILAEAYRKSIDGNTLENVTETGMQKGLVWACAAVFQLICIYGILLNGLQHFLPAVSLPHISLEQYTEYFEIHMNQDTLFHKISALYEQWELSVVLVTVCLTWKSLSCTDGWKNIRKKIIVMACCTLLYLLVLAGAVYLEGMDRLFVLYLREQCALLALIIINRMDKSLPEAAFMPTADDLPE